MEDQILHALVCDGQAALTMVNGSASAKQAAELLHLNQGVACALGRLLCAGAMLAQRNKNESEKLTVMVSGGGPVGKLLVTADNAGHVKGCVDVPDAVSPARKEDISALVGKTGQITVVRDNPLGKEPYVGMCNLVSGDITRDFAAYLVTSEQQPAGVALDAGACGGRFTCGGMMVMPLPGCSARALDQIDAKIKGINDLLERLNDHLSLEEMAFDLFWDVGVKPLETVPLAYHCDCSRERFLKGLIALGKNELLSMAYDTKPTEICCRFCNKTYRFEPQELKELTKGM